VHRPLSLVLIAPTHKGTARLSWLGRLVTHGLHIYRRPTCDFITCRFIQLVCKFSNTLLRPEKCNTIFYCNYSQTATKVRYNNIRNKIIKPKDCPRIAAVASVGSNKVTPFSGWHFVNPGQLVHAVSCTQETHKNPYDLDLWPMIFNRVLEVAKNMFTQNFTKLNAVVYESSCWQSTNAENNTATASAGSNKQLPSRPVFVIVV